MSKPVILCVDDEILVLNSLKIQLKNEFGNAYLYEVAESADEAMEVIEELEETNTPILAIVSDWLMPGIKGDEFLIRVHQRYPHIIKVLLTGQVDDAVIERAKIEANLHSYLHKPWQGRELIEIINSGLANL
jgi:CheY-like chemotaxis protein